MPPAIKQQCSRNKNSNREWLQLDRKAIFCPRQYLFAKLLASVLLWWDAFQREICPYSCPLPYPGMLVTNKKKLKVINDWVYPRLLPSFEDFITGQGHSALPRGGGGRHKFNFITQRWIFP